MTTRGRRRLMATLAVALAAMVGPQPSLAQGGGADCDADCTSCVCNSKGEAICCVWIGGNYLGCENMGTGGICGS